MIRSVELDVEGNATCHEPFVSTLFYRYSVHIAALQFSFKLLLTVHFLTLHLVHFASHFTTFKRNQELSVDLARKLSSYSITGTHQYLRRSHI